MARIPGHSILTSAKAPGFRHIGQAFGADHNFSEPAKQMSYPGNPTAISKKGNSLSEADLVWQRGQDVREGYFPACGPGTWDLGPWAKQTLSVGKLHLLRKITPIKTV